MKTIKAILFSGGFLFAAAAFGADYAERYDFTERYERAIGRLSMANTESERFYALREAAKTSFALGKIEIARKYAKELSDLAPKFESDWNYGNALHDANLVLGRIAVHENNLEKARLHLLEAGRSPGSPQLNSFGPNMSLAKDLLEKGERDTVLKYLELCGRFWTKRDRLQEWDAAIRAGEIPNFRVNLVL